MTPYLTEVTVDLPMDPVAWYLLGRRLYFERSYAAAVPALSRATWLLEVANVAQRRAVADETRELVAGEAWRLLGRALCLSGDEGAADRAFSAAAAIVRWDGQRLELEDWRARCRWRAAGSP